ncbi:MAG: molybdopterin-dependent oxidoreductase, partial [Calditrichaeota bacterium]|nr:molybdopterin-dependent oxidoreductase [Calditrichota bacterium]
DPETGKGQPFAYHVYGTGIVEVTVDCLRGTATVDAVKILHDVGQSLNPLIDRGQVEGAVVQGLGWVMLEEVLHDDRGRLLTDSLSTYKIPDIHFAPEIEVQFLGDSENPVGPYHSKAIGEPPFMYGLAAYFAILDALRAFNPNLQPFYDSPLTPEKILLALYDRPADRETAK